MPCYRGRSKVKLNSPYTPETFSRMNTTITLDSVADLTPHSLPAWKAVHVVLNASHEGLLSTEKLWDAICSSFPKRNFVKATLSHTLSHSDDFAQMVYDGKSACRWFLTGTCNGVKRGGKIGCHSPTTFDRQSTHYTLRDVGPGPPVWKMIHAVLNNSAEGCLTTQEVKEAIRSHYPEREISPNTLGYTLAKSDDFEQVFKEGRFPGQWFLTGTGNGINRTNANRATEFHAEHGLPPASDGNDDLATERDAPLAPEISCPNEKDGFEVRFSPGTILSSPTSLSPHPEFNLSPPPPASRAVRDSQATDGYQPYPGTENVQEYKSPDPQVQLDTLPSPSDTKSSDASNYFTSEDLCALYNVLQAPPSPSAPSSIPSIDDPFLKNSVSSDPTLASQNPNGAFPYHPHNTYLADFRSNAAGLSDLRGSFEERSIQTSFLGVDSVQQRASGAIIETTAQEPVCSTPAAGRQVLAHTSHSLAYETYSRGCLPRDGSFDSSQAVGGMTSLEQDQPERDVTLAELPFDTFSFPMGILFNLDSDL